MESLETRTRGFPLCCNSHKSWLCQRHIRLACSCTTKALTNTSNTFLKTERIVIFCVSRRKLFFFVELTLVEMESAGPSVSVGSLSRYTRDKMVDNTCDVGR
ncbi:hypothetical protein PoB_004014500 [Plakobranchus ocellatus]|uniref:Uncharacterized protein n=1 Tax=Plakobranchus ocellatus TaxID=259542 RepID=A0AAV4B218_9GAST|nr:hypothetical protein PoB_004014500 [Plakobranchus ocellatus]